MVNWNRFGRRELAAPRGQDGRVVCRAARVSETAFHRLRVGSIHASLRACAKFGAALALAALTAVPSAAQTRGVLASNTGQSEAATVGSFSSDHAQKFTTGANGDGYTLTSVALRLRHSGTQPTFAVSIRSDSAGSPGSALGTLTGPASLPSGQALSRSPPRAAAST